MAPAAEDALLVKVAVVSLACGLTVTAVAYAVSRAVLDKVWPPRPE